VLLLRVFTVAEAFQTEFPLFVRFTPFRRHWKERLMLTFAPPPPAVTANVVPPPLETRRVLGFTSATRFGAGSLGLPSLSTVAALLVLEQPALLVTTQV
jgi:hypothetical protein